jgi:hypothetical protein
MAASLSRDPRYARRFSPGVLDWPPSITFSRPGSARSRRRLAPIVDALESRLVLTPAAVTGLNNLILEFAHSHLGQKVGGGECGQLVTEALRVAGGDFAIHDPGNDNDFIWGNLITTITPGHDSNPTVPCVPGDIVQFNNVVFAGGGSANPHTAIVAAVDANGRPTEVYEQNSNNIRSDRYDSSVINAATITAGIIHIYQPVPRVDSTGKVQFTVVNNTPSAQTVTAYLNGQVFTTFSLSAFNTTHSNAYDYVSSTSPGNWTIGVNGHQVPLTNADGYELYTTGGGASIRVLNDSVSGTSTMLTGAFLTDGAETESGANKSMTFDKVIQGQSDTCGFTAVLSAVAMSGFNLASGITVADTKSPTDVVYDVRLFQPLAGGGFQQDEIPVEFNGTFTPGDARSSDPNEFWPTIYQRAYLSLESSLGQGVGTFDSAIEALTGRSPTSLIGGTVAPNVFTALLDNGSPVVASTTYSVDPYNLDPAEGIIGSHAYTVVGVQSSGGSTYVTLRNPWGQDSTPGYADAIDGVNDGIIRVPWTTFIRYFISFESIPISGPSINMPQEPGPTFNNPSPGAISVYVGQQVGPLDFSAVDSQGRPLAYTLTGNNVGLVSSAGSFVWIPGPNDVGEHLITVKAEANPVSSANETFNVTVLPDQPTVGAVLVNPTSISAAGTDKLTLQAAGVSDSLGSVQDVDFRVDVVNQNGIGQLHADLGTATAATNWTWSGFVGGLAPGTYTVSAVASNGVFQSLPATSTLTVTPAPDYEPLINRANGQIQASPDSPPSDSPFALGTTIDASGHIRVFWTNQLSPQSQFVREYDKNGDPLSSAVQLPISVTTSVETAVFAGLPDGSFDEVYTSSGSVIVQRYSASAQTIGLPDVVGNNASFFISLPPSVKVAADGAGDLLIAYNVGVHEIDAVSVSPTGAVARGPWVVDSSPAGFQSLASVALNASGAGVIAWNDGGQHSLVADRVSNAGLTSGTNDLSVLQDPSVSEGSAGVDRNGDLTFVYVAFGGVHTRRISADGTTDSGDQVLYTSVNDSPLFPTVAVNSEGWAFATWDDPQYGPNGAMTLGKLIDPKGRVQSSYIQIPTIVLTDTFAGVAINDQGRISVAFTQANANNPSVTAASFSVFWADMEPVFPPGPFQFNVPLGSAAGTVVGKVTATDPDGDELSYSLQSPGPFAINPSTGVITVADPSALQSTTATAYNLSVQASDSNPTANVLPVASVQISVVDPTPPQFAPMPNWTIDAGESIVPVIQSTDPTGAELTYSAVAGDGATATVSGNDLSVVPALGFTGTFPVTVTATNGLASSNTTFNVTVVTPSLAPLPDITIAGPSTVKLVGSDASGTALTYSALITGGGTVPAPATLSIQNNILSIAPAAGFSGTFTVLASANDGPDTASQSFKVTVKPVQTIPTLIQFSNSIYIVNSTAGAEQITVRRSGNLSTSAAVIVSTPGGHEVGPFQQTVRFAPNVTNMLVSIPVQNDGQAGENDIDIPLSLSSPSTGVTLGSMNSATLVVHDTNPFLAPAQIISLTTPTVRVTVGAGKRAKSKKETIIQLQLSEGVSGSTNLDAYQVLSGKSKKGVTTFNKPVPLVSASYNPATFMITLVPAGTLILSQPEQLTVTAALLTDALGRPLDGNHDGVPGGNFVATFGKGGVKILRVQR